MTTTMSIYQAKKPVRQMDAHSTYLATSTKQDLQLVRLSVDTGKPVLVGMDGVHTIVKPVADGDDRRSFEALYDDALTITDLETMKKAGVKKPEDVPPTQVRLEVGFPVQLLVSMDFALQCPNPHEARSTFRQLILSDAKFRSAIHRQIALVVYAVIGNNAELEFTFEDQESREGTIEPPLAKDEKWRLIDGKD